MGLSKRPEAAVNSLTMGTLPGYLEEVLASSLGWGDLPWARTAGPELALSHPGWMMEIPGGKVLLELNNRHDWDAIALTRRLTNFDVCLRRAENGLELKWQWPHGSFRSAEVDQVLGRGLNKIIEDRGGTEVCLLGGVFLLVFGEDEVSITMQVATGENGGIWVETVPYDLASELLADVHAFLRDVLG